MDEKAMLEGILWDLKGLSDLYLHGVIESGTSNVHRTFLNGLTTILEMQHGLYDLMSESNMYSVTNVSTSKLEKTKNKFKREKED